MSASTSMVIDDAPESMELSTSSLMAETGENMEDDERIDTEESFGSCLMVIYSGGTVGSRSLVVIAFRACASASL